MGSLHKDGAAFSVEVDGQKYLVFYYRSVLKPGEHKFRNERHSWYYLVRADGLFPMSPSELGRMSFLTVDPETWEVVKEHGNFRDTLLPLLQQDYPVRYVHES